MISDRPDIRRLLLPRRWMSGLCLTAMLLLSGCVSPTEDAGAGRGTAGGSTTEPAVDAAHDANSDHAPARVASGQTVGSIGAVSAGDLHQRAASASDFNAVRGTGSGATNEIAVDVAHYAIFERALGTIAGDQASGSIGAGFKRDFDRDPRAFRARYFGADTTWRCQEPAAAQALCEVSGSFSLAALRQDVRARLRQVEATLSNQLVYVLSSAPSNDSRVAFVVDRLQGAFAAAGHRLLSGGAANDAIANGRADFALGIAEVAFSDTAWDPYEQRLSGAVTVRFGLRDMRGGQQVASVPVAVSAVLSGPAAAPLEAEIVGELATRAGREIARQVNAAVVDFQEQRGSIAAAGQRAASGQRLFVLRLRGTSQRDRETIRGVRETIRAAFADADPAVDPQQSDGSQVTVTFATTGRLVPDDFIDDLYARHAQQHHFDAEYVGNNEFILHF